MNVKPRARNWMTVVITFIAFSMDDIPRRMMPISQKSWPRVAMTASGGYDVQPEFAAPPVTQKLAEHQQPGSEKIQ